MEKRSTVSSAQPAKQSYVILYQAYCKTALTSFHGSVAPYDTILACSRIVLAEDHVLHKFLRAPATSLLPRWPMLSNLFRHHLETDSGIHFLEMQK